MWYSTAPGQMKSRSDELEDEAAEDEHHDAAVAVILLAVAARRSATEVRPSARATRSLDRTGGT
jgi:hypothetical protein